MVLISLLTIIPPFFSLFSESRLLYENQTASREGPAIWYVIHCQRQREQDFICACRNYFDSPALEDAFVFTYDRMRRYEGAWHLETCLLFPGYVFLESSQGEWLEKEWKRIPSMWPLLERDSQLVPVRPEEESFLKGICGTGHHFGMSGDISGKGRLL